MDKGETDIRMVYNSTSCGLNAYLYAPHYGLLTVKHMLRSLREGYYQCDLDVGKQFLNYKLHRHLQLLSGVDVRKVRSIDPSDALWEATQPGNWERWEQNWMGLRDSPYRSLQWQARLKLELYGDCRVRSNPFHWETVIFNLPGAKGYWADLLWVFKLRWDGKLGVKVFVYVDNGRAVGPTEFLTWMAARWYGSGCTRRGVQDASQKADVPFANSRALGRHSDSHRGWKDMWNVVAREVGKDPASHRRKVGNDGPGSLPPGKTPANQRILDVFGQDLPMDEFLHEGAATHN